MRTDEGGDSLELSVAKIVLKDLLLLRCYAAPELGGSWRYTVADVELARRNEAAAACRGLDAQIERPFGNGSAGSRPAGARGPGLPYHEPTDAPGYSFRPRCPTVRG